MKSLIVKTFRLVVDRFRNGNCMISKVDLDRKPPVVDTPIAEQISDSVQGKDEPMETSHPEAPPLLVFASYPVILIIALIVGIVAWSIGRV
jgi:hypothetical protein